jgi:hypothetical protein
VRIDEARERERERERKRERERERVRVYEQGAYYANNSFTKLIATRRELRPLFGLSPESFARRDLNHER